MAGSPLGVHWGVPKMTTLRDWTASPKQAMPMPLTPTPHMGPDLERVTTGGIHPDEVTAESGGPEGKMGGVLRQSMERGATGPASIPDPQERC